jgi:hypothetical protein
MENTPEISKMTTKGMSILNLPRRAAGLPAALAENGS